MLEENLPTSDKSLTNSDRKTGDNELTCAEGHQQILYTILCGKQVNWQ